MRRQILMASASLALFCAGPAFSQQVTPSEAEDIQQKVTRYLPKDLVDAGLDQVQIGRAHV